MTTNPIIAYLPALPLAKNIVMGDWVVGKPDDSVEWRSEKFQALVKALISSFSTEGFRNGSFLWHQRNGFDGEMPTPDEAQAIQAALTLSVIEVNDQLSDDPNKGHFMATTENTTIIFQQIDEAQGWITHLRGGVLRRVMDGGHRIGEKPPPLPDAIVPIQRPVRASGILASAVYEALVQGDSAGHVRTALEWHRTAMANPAAVTWQQRIICIKTGFEALLGTSKSWPAAQKLQKLFETATQPHHAHLPWSGILWSPTERTDLAREYTSQNGTTHSVTRTELQDWFMTLAQARNSIIHDGVLSLTEYAAPVERPLSRYAGNLFWTGERVLREAIKATIGTDILLCGLLKNVAVMEALGRELLKLVDDETKDQERPARQIPETVDEVRPLAELLGLLRCGAANEVQLKRATQGVGSTEEIARAGANASRNTWSATVGGVSVGVNRAERLLLKDHGAEDALPSYFAPCD